MSNPLSIFRRHQKMLLAVFGVTIILIFVIGSSLDKMFSGPPGAGGGPRGSIVSWKNGSFTERQFTLIKRRHGRAMDFLRNVVEATRRADGNPKAQLIQAAGNEEELLARIILADEAEKMGVVIDDQAVQDYLSLLSDETLSTLEFSEILRQVDRNMTEDILFTQLKTELLARNMQEMARTALRTAPPSQTWQYFLRMNRRAVAEIYPIKTEAYVAQVTDEPSEAELQALFEKHKTQFNNPNSPDPGFRQPLKIAFQYFKVSFEDYLQEEVKKITEEAIKAEYEKRVGQGQYKTTEPPPGEKTEGDKEGDAKEGDAKEGDAKEGDAKEGDAKEGDAKEGDAKEGDAKEGDAKEGDNKEPPKSETPGERTPEKPDDDGQCQDETQPPKAGDDKPDEKKADDDKPGEQADGDKPADKKADDKKADDKKADDKKAADDKPTDEKAGDKPADDKSADEKSTDEKAEGDKPADETAADDKPAERTKTLDEVRDEVARSLARPNAQKRLDDAVKDVERQLKRYSTALARYKAITENPDLKSGAQAPTPLDFEGLAAKHGLTLGQTRLAGPLEIAETELGQAQTFSFAGGQFQQITFPQIAYRPGVPLYQPGQIGGQLSDTTFIFWRTQEEAERIPAFADVKNDVLDAWKRSKAVELATEAAEEIKAKLESANKPMAEVLDEDQAKNVVRPLPFSWLTQGAAMRFQGPGLPRMSEVEGVSVVGEDFMKSVFQAEADSVVVAANNPESEVCVVKIQAFTPDNEALRKQFMTIGPTASEGFLASMDAQIILSDWYRGMLEDLEVKWAEGREPETFSN